MSNDYNSFTFCPDIMTLRESLSVLKYKYPTMPFSMVLSAVYYANVYSFESTGMTITFDDTIVFDDLTTEKLNSILRHLSDKVPSHIEDLNDINYDEITPISTEEDYADLCIEDALMLTDAVKNGIPDINIEKVRR